MDCDEKWLPVPAYEGIYEVSDHGRVRSLDRDVITGTGTRRYQGKVLATTPNGGGYPTVKLSKAGETATCQVHLLVLAAHVGPPPPGEEACHGPAGKSDASRANLCWGTRAKNVGPDRLRDGQDNRGERHGQAVLTRVIVLDIRARVSAGERQVDVADAYGIRKGLVWAVVHRKCWDWL